MKQSLILFLALASVFPLPTFAADTGSLPKADFSALRSTGSAKVVQVIDPQTVLLEKGRIVRLTGIELPDYAPDNPGPFALLTLKILKDMLEDQRVELYQTQNRKLGRMNRMGHHLAHLERQSDQIWVQGTLISLGLARVMTTQRNPEMAESMYELEAKARTQKLGIWEDGAYKILTPAETPDHLHSYQIVEGKIESASIRQNRVYLNFGKDWRTDFTVSIPPGEHRKFSAQKINPLDWNGETLRVRGWIESYNGPYIEINHPETVEVISAQASAGAPADALPAMPLPDAPQAPMVKTIENN